MRAPSREEIIVVAGLALGAVLCLTSGTGLDFVFVFRQYVSFLGPFVLGMVVASRVPIWFGRRPAPTADTPARWHRWAFGDPKTRTPLLDLDLEFLRAALLTFATFAIYSNVKVRLSFINSADGDPLFLWLDGLMFFDHLAPWVERWFQESASVSGFFARVYAEDWLFMLVIAGGLYTRSDATGLRWLMLSTCILYLLGIFTTAAWPSVGPCFADASRFAWVHETPMGTAQAGLVGFFNASVDAVQGGRPAVGRAFLGIAAFPSMHVGHMALLTIVARWWFRPLGWLMAALTTLTFVATIGFGWHYVVDGIVGVAMAWGVARAVARWVGLGEPVSPL